MQDCENAVSFPNTEVKVPNADVICWVTARERLSASAKTSFGKLLHGFIIRLVSEYKYIDSHGV